MKVKKAYFVLLSILIASVTLSICGLQTVSAASCGGVETSLIECSGGGDSGIYHILALVLDIMTIGIGILAVVGISWAGIQYLTAGGSEERTLKAKRRIYEIVVGLACYMVIWVFSSWLLPGGILNIRVDNTGVDSVVLSFTGDAKVGDTISPTVKLNGNVKDATYSLSSDNPLIAGAFNRYVKCVANGSATITALTANGKTSAAKITCTGGSDDSSDSEDDDLAADGSVAAVDGSPTVTGKSEMRMKGNPHMRKKTRETIEEHKSDFYSDNYTSVIKNKYGGYTKYVKGLGGVFSGISKTKKGRIPVKTAADFQAAAEYVFGLLSIWGPDYSNGDPEHQYSWQSSDAFYQRESSFTRQHAAYHYPVEPVDDMLKKAGSPSFASSSIDVNCDKSFYIFIKSTSLAQERGFARKGKRITKVSDLRVGDIIHMPGHIFAVGEVYKDKIVMYDGGSRWQRYKTFKFTIKRTDSNKLGGTYGYNTSWEAYRPWNIKQNITLKGLN